MQQDRLAFKIPYLIEGQAEGQFAIVVLALLALAALACTALWLRRRPLPDLPHPKIEKAPTTRAAEAPSTPRTRPRPAGSGSGPNKRAYRNQK